MRGLDNGSSYVVTRNGVPVGELSPRRRYRFVRVETVKAVFAGAPGIDLQRLRDDLGQQASQDSPPRG